MKSKNESNKEMKSKAIKYALFLLGSRPYLSCQIHQKVLGKFEDEQTAREVVEYLKSHLLLNDIEYCRSYARNCCEYRAKGLRRVKLELKAKGATSDLIENAFCDFEVEDNPEEALRKYLKKRSNLSKDKLYNRALAYLMSRGFDYDKCKQIVKNSCN